MATPVPMPTLPTGTTEGETRKESKDAMEKGDRREKTKADLDELTHQKVPLHDDVRSFATHCIFDLPSIMQTSTVHLEVSQQLLTMLRLRMSLETQYATELARIASLPGPLNHPQIHHPLHHHLNEKTSASTFATTSTTATSSTLFLPNPTWVEALKGLQRMYQMASTQHATFAKQLQEDVYQDMAEMVAAQQRKQVKYQNLVEKMKKKVDRMEQLYTKSYQNTLSQFQETTQILLANSSISNSNSSSSNSTSDSFPASATISKDHANVNAHTHVNTLVDVDVDVDVDVNMNMNMNHDIQPNMNRPRHATSWQQNEPTSMSVSVPTPTPSPTNPSSLLLSPFQDSTSPRNASTTWLSSSQAWNASRSRFETFKSSFQKQKNRATAMTSTSTWLLTSPRSQGKKQTTRNNDHLHLSTDQKSISINNQSNNQNISISSPASPSTSSTSSSSSSSLVAWLLPSNSEKLSVGEQISQLMEATEAYKKICIESWEQLREARHEQYRSLQTIATEYQIMEEERIQNISTNVCKHLVFESSVLANQQYDLQRLFPVLEAIHAERDLNDMIDAISSTGNTSPYPTPLNGKQPQTQQQSLRQLHEMSLNELALLNPLLQGKRGRTWSSYEEESQPLSSACAVGAGAAAAVALSPTAALVSTSEASQEEDGAQCSSKDRVGITSTTTTTTPTTTTPLHASLATRSPSPSPSSKAPLRNTSSFLGFKQGKLLPYPPTKQTLRITDYMRRSFPHQNVQEGTPVLGHLLTPWDIQVVVRNEGTPLRSERVKIDGADFPRANIPFREQGNVGKRHGKKEENDEKREDELNDEQQQQQQQKQQQQQQQQRGEGDDGNQAKEQQATRAATLTSAAAAVVPTTDADGLCPAMKRRSEVAPGSKVAQQLRALTELTAGGFHPAKSTSSSSSSSYSTTTSTTSSSTTTSTTSSLFTDQLYYESNGSFSQKSRPNMLRTEATRKNTTTDTNFDASPQAISEEQLDFNQNNMLTSSSSFPPPTFVTPAFSSLSLTSSFSSGVVGVAVDVHAQEKANGVPGAHGMEQRQSRDESMLLLTNAFQHKEFIVYSDDEDVDEDVDEGEEEEKEEGEGRKERDDDDGEQDNVDKK